MTYDHEATMRSIAYHEAAHTVIALGMGWKVVSVEIDAEGAGVSRGRRDPREHLVDVVVNLAGRAAEFKLHGRAWREDDEEVESALISPEEHTDHFDEEGEPMEPYDDSVQAMQSLWAWFYRGTDFEAAEPFLGAGCEPGAFLIERYREAEQFAAALVTRPDVWSSIEAVAAALLERGRLGHDDVMALVAKSLSDAPLIEALVTELKAGWDQLDPAPVVFMAAE